MATVKTVTETRSPQETFELGCQMGREADEGSLVILEGDLGTGKTVLARGVAHGLGIETWRGSPTYNLVHEYVGRLPLFHLDAYRISGMELVDLDLEHLRDAGGVVMVEWGGKVFEELQVLQPNHTIQARLFDLGDDKRRIEVSG